MSNTTNTPSVKAKITWINANAADARKATASVTIGGAFQVHGISVFQGKNGTFLSMPQRQVTSHLQPQGKGCRLSAAAVQPFILNAPALKS